MEGRQASRQLKLLGSSLHYSSLKRAITTMVQDKLNISAASAIQNVKAGTLRLNTEYCNHNIIESLRQPLEATQWLIRHAVVSGCG
jgi:hypothetical protein